uniref:Steroidogenic acute regulatory protein, mitochondrial n=1 Tax=Anas platyrhynchos TaxID=8839 RepID=A0A8B9SNH4_ANAPL
MLQATVKLCCGIAHDHLRRLPGEYPGKTADLRGWKEVLGGGQKENLGGDAQQVQKEMLGGSPSPEETSAPARFSSTDLSYIHQGERALQRALSILSGALGGEGLTRCCAPQDAGAAVSSAVLPGLGRVFRVEAVLAAPLGWLHRQLFEELEQMPRWNPTLSRVLQRPGEDTLVTHEVTSASPVGRRDFVSVRHRRRTQAAVYLVGTATHLERLPAQEGCIRAETRLSCIALQPLAGDPGCTRVTWLLSVDLKGWIPSAVTDRVLPRCQADFIGHLRRHLSATTRP